MKKKFKLLTKETKEFYGVKLYRIEALIDFYDVKKGDKGGFVEKEENLSQEGNSWVYGDSQVFGNSQVYGNSRVFGNSQVYGNSRVYGKIKCEAGYYFAYKEKSWKVEEVELDENSVVLWRK